VVYTSASVSFWAVTISDGFSCKRRGRCYRRQTINVEEDDIYRWVIEEREDILVWVDPIAFSGDIVIYDFPIDPTTGEEYDNSCPFLEKLSDQGIYICQIHDTRLEICAAFPSSKQHAEDLGCPGYDYQKIVVALKETMRLMEEIDALIPSWPIE
jgi:Fe-S-cluster containining protein